MKKFIIIILLFTITSVHAQVDKNGQPVFNSVTTSEDSINDFLLISNYYTLKNNIENKGSAVYISDNPGLDEIYTAAINLPSDFFVISKDYTVKYLIILNHRPSRNFFVVNTLTNKESVFKCILKGQITEDRANEIIQSKYDPMARIADNKLYFNNRKLKIITKEEIRKAIRSLIEKEKLSDISARSKSKLLSKSELRALILAETKEGGKLDFFTPIKGKENEVVQVKPGVISLNKEMALINWARSNALLGVSLAEDALSIFAEFKGRALNTYETETIKAAFNKAREK